MATAGPAAGGGAFGESGGRPRVLGRRYPALRRRPRLKAVLAYWAVSWLFTLVLLVLPGLAGIGGLSGLALSPALVRAAEQDGALGVAAKLVYLAGAAALFGPLMQPLAPLNWALNPPLEDRGA